jgi:hypothetical protein
MQRKRLDLRGSVRRGGYAVIAFFLHYLQTRTLKIFVYYRALFGIVVLLLAFLPWGSAR